MKVIKALVLTSFLVGSLAMATDSEKSANDSTKVSKNPITGSVTRTAKMNRKLKYKNGHKAEVNVTDKMTTKKNGEVEENIKVDSDSKPAN